MPRRQFLAQVARTAAVVALSPHLAFASETWAQVDTADSRAMVDRVMQASVRAVRTDAHATVDAFTLDRAVLKTADGMQTAIRAAGQRVISEYPHAPDSPYGRAKAAGTLSQLRVLLKLNIGGHDRLQDLDYTTVSPLFAEGLIEGLVGLGIDPAHITLAEGARYGNADYMLHVLDASGYLRVLGRHKLRFLDLNAYPAEYNAASHQVLKLAGVDPEQYATSQQWIKMTPSAALAKSVPAAWLPAHLGAAGAVLLPRGYVEHLDEGWVIDVAKLKVHRLAVASGAIKNLMGVIGFAFPPGTADWKLPPHMQKAYIHEGFRFGADRAHFIAIQNQQAARLGDVFLAARPHLAIYDGILTSGGDGFSIVYPVRAPITFASQNAIFADVAAGDALGLTHAEAMQKIMGYATPPIAHALLSRFYPGLQRSAIVQNQDGIRVAGIGVAKTPYYCLLAFKGDHPAPGNPSYTAIGTPPKHGSQEVAVDMSEFRTPFPRLVPTVVKVAEADVLVRPAEAATVLFKLIHGDRIFVRGTDKIRCRFLADGLACASPRTNQTVRQDNVWLLIDRNGDGRHTGWMRGSDVELLRA